jgi:hypothetical protein
MTPRLNRRKRAGETLVEFTLVGIPLIFMLLSTAEMARVMWTYQMLAYSVKAGARYASVHGQGCTTGNNTCSVKVSDVAHEIALRGVGLVPSSFSVTLQSATAAPVTCAPLSSCFTNPALWPGVGDNVPGLPLSIAATYRISTPMALFWPGAGRNSIGAFTLGVWTKQSIHF